VANTAILCGLFLSWKAGFARYDPSHAAVPFAYALVAPWLVARAPAARPRFQRGLAWLGAACALCGLFYLGRDQGYTPLAAVRLPLERLARNARTLLAPGAVRAAHDAAVQRIAGRAALPRIREAVGRSSVDIFPSAQGLVFLNGLRYRPRPVAQGHLAFSPFLQQLNRSFYDDPSRAPEFVIFAVAPIDDRFPTLEDSGALQAIVRHYEPLLVEGDLILLRRAERAPGSHDSAAPPLLERSLRLGEFLDVGERSALPLRLALDVRASALGRLVSFVHRSPRLELEIEASDGSRASFRFVPSAGRLPFPVNPLRLEPRDWQRWYAGEPLKRLRAFRVVARSRWSRAAFAPELAVRLYEDAAQGVPTAKRTR
jgi:hypothetical protein